MKEEIIGCERLEDETNLKYKCENPDHDGFEKKPRKPTGEFRGICKPTNALKNPPGKLGSIRED